METKGSFMISTEEYWKLLYAKATLEVLKKTYEKYGVVEFLDTCLRQFKEMDKEKVGEK